MQNLEIDLTDELARLLSYTAGVAIAIRLNSAYRSDYKEQNPQHGYDVMWLADSLHNFDMLARAIQESNSAEIARACDMLLSFYAMYTHGPTEGNKGDPQGSFARHARYANLDEALAVFKAIKAKVTPRLVTVET